MAGIDTTMNSALSPTEQNRLRELERIVSTKDSSFLEIGEALTAIREEKLYRPLKFEEYFEVRSKFSYNRGNQLIRAWDMKTRLKIDLPSEGHYRAIRRIPEKELVAFVRSLNGASVRETEQRVRDYCAPRGIGRTYNHHPRLMALAESLATLDGRWFPEHTTELTPPEARKQLREIEKAIKVLEEAKEAVDYRAQTMHSWGGR